MSNPTLPHQEARLVPAMPKSGDKHNAPGPTAGYLYQCRYALLEALRQAFTNPQLQISIEQLDDVAFETGGDPVALLQTKHHLNARAALTNSCSDLWKTVGIWCAEIAANPEVLSRVKLFLVSTAIAPEGSAASYLRKNGRDEGRSHVLLCEAIKSSESKLNLPAYMAFANLTPSAQLALLSSIEIIDGTPGLAELDAPLLHEIRLLGPSNVLAQILQRVEGWWWRRISAALVDKTQNRISILELEAALAEIREGFKRSSLPIDYASADPPPEHLEAYDNTLFVQSIQEYYRGCAESDVGGTPGDRRKRTKADGWRCTRPDAGINVVHDRQ